MGQTSELKELQSYIHSIAKNHGFWERDRNEGELIALIHSELSEALEGLRHGNPPDRHLAEFDSVSVELADVLIRVFDFAQGCGYDVISALFAKIEFNRTRKYKHGKQF